MQLSKRKQSVLWCFVFVSLQNKNKCCKYKHMLVGCWSACGATYYSWYNYYITLFSLGTTCIPAFYFIYCFFAFVISHFLVLCFRFCFLASCNGTHYNHWLDGLIVQVKLHKGKFQNQKHKKVKAHFRLKFVFVFCVVLVSIIKTPLIKCNLKVDD